MLIVLESSNNMVIDCASCCKIDFLFRGFSIGYIFLSFDYTVVVNVVILSVTLLRKIFSATFYDFYEFSH